MTSTKRRSKEVEKKEIKVDNTSPVIEESTSKFLEPNDLRFLETLGRDVENSKLLMALEEQSLTNMSLQLENLQLKIEKQRHVIASRSQGYEASKGKFISFKKEIWPKYGLSEEARMGYDPISGEIK